MKPPLLPEGIDYFELNHTFRSGSGEAMAEMQVPMYRNSLADDGAGSLYLPAYGERGRTTGRVLHHLEQQGIGATAIGIHFNLVPRTLDETRAATVERVCREVLPWVIDAELATVPDTELPCFTNSLGSAMLAFALRETGGEHIGDIASVNPLGSTRIGETMHPTDAGFLLRFGLGAMKLPTERFYRHISTDFFRELGGDMRRRTFWEQNKVANRLDIVPDQFAHAARGHEATTITGSKDRFLRSARVVERIRMFEATNPGNDGLVQVIELPGLSHSSSGFKRGLEAVTLAATIATGKVAA